MKLWPALKSFQLKFKTENDFILLEKNSVQFWKYREINFKWCLLKDNTDWIEERRWSVISTTIRLITRPVIEYRTHRILNFSGNPIPITPPPPHHCFNERWKWIWRRRKKGFHSFEWMYVVYIVCCVVIAIAKTMDRLESNRKSKIKTDWFD